MALMSSAEWSHTQAAAAAATDDDFHQFIDLGDVAGGMGDPMSFDFGSFGDSNPASHHMMAHSVSMAEATMSLGGGTTGSREGATVPAPMMPLQQSQDDRLSQLEAQVRYLRQQQQREESQRRAQQARFMTNPHASRIPPTPQSLEMPPATTMSQFYSHDHNMMDAYHALGDIHDPMILTPLVSPAVTPMEPHFSISESFGMDFTPITSPALDPTSDIYANHAGNTDGNSPDMRLDSTTASRTNTAPAKTVGGVRKSSTVSKPRGKPSVRQSPIVKPKRQKQGSTASIATQFMSELQRSSATSPQLDPQIRRLAPSSTSRSGESTSDELTSVSPEPLSEMPPPPIPARKSPFVAAQNNGDKHAAGPVMGLLAGGRLSPATPASLMRLPASTTESPETTSGAEAHMADVIEAFELPESAGFPKAQQLASDGRGSGTPSTLRIDPGASRPGSFQELPSPSMARPSGSMATASPSPSLGPSQPSPANPRKTPQLQPQRAKGKRQSTSLVSPSLRPKISPNIRPLIPSTPGMSAEDLASKSNYQRIVEGNNLPGVVYPSELSTNLTSKRTSHKLAEQGRRNRINTALQEIAALLPGGISADMFSMGDDDEGTSKKESKQGNAPSKANTVERAIEYIKDLRKQLDEATQRAENAERMLAMKDGDDTEDKTESVPATSVSPPAVSPST